MPILDDGTVIPSYLGVENRGATLGVDPRLNDDRLRIGEVVGVVYPDDDRSFSKTDNETEGRPVEYILRAQHRGGDGVVSTSEYRGVTLSSLFGSAADHFSASLRVDDNQDKDNKGFGTGARVVFLGINGDQRRALILGGIENFSTDRIPAHKEEDAPKLYWEFNGFRVQIRKDGEAVIEFRGATKNDGSLTDDADEDAEGTSIYFQKDGSVSIGTGHNDGNPILTLDLPNKRIEIKADGKFEVEVKDDINILGNKKALIDVDDEARVSSGKKIVLSSGDGVYCGDADEPWVKGKTYRDGEGQMNSSIKTALNVASKALSTASTTLNSAASANAVPYTGGAAAQTPFAAAAQALNIAAQALGQAADAIGNFENNASQYLSKRNFGD